MRICHSTFALFVVAISLLTAVDARAETVDVAGVSADDVLNLRSEPRGDAPLVGALSSTAGAIEVVRRSEGWAYVKTGSQAGWASARFLVPTRTFESGKPPSPLQCIGTEPFWALVVDGDRATYSSPDVKPVTVSIGKIQQSRNTLTTWRLSMNGGPIASAIIEARQACSDNMSDRVFPFRVHVEARDATFFSGCCDLKR
jgi:uncharacterized membrane protein